MTQVLALHGGLGNQLFQFAAALGCGWSEPIAVDNRLAVRWGNPLFEALRPGAVRPATAWELARLRQVPRIPRVQFKLLGLQRRLDSALENRRVWDEPTGSPSASAIPKGSLLLRGYFQDESYFAHAKRAVRGAIAIQPAAPQTADPRLTVAISFRRRADYASRGLRLNWSYYAAALAELQGSIGRQHDLVITSDEPLDALTLRELTASTDGVITDVSSASPLDQLSALAAARHCIIPNSSFAWWGAWIGDEDAASPGSSDRHVIAPRPWPSHPGDPCPGRWHRISATFDPPVQ